MTAVTCATIYRRALDRAGVLARTQVSGDNLLTLTPDNLFGRSDTEALTINGDAGNTAIGGEAFAVYPRVTTQDPATLVFNDFIDQSGVGGP